MPKNAINVVAFLAAWAVRLSIAGLRGLRSLEAPRVLCKIFLGTSRANG